MSKPKNNSTLAPPSNAQSKSWKMIAFGLRIDKKPSNSELAQALRGSEEIPRTARDYIASLLEGKPRGRPALSEWQRSRRRVTAQLTYLKAREQILEEDAKAKPFTKGRGRRPAQTERILERTSHLLATKEKINLSPSAIKEYVVGVDDEFDALFEDHGDRLGR